MRQIIVGISAVFLAAFLDLTDNTSVSVAFPSIASSLGASHTVLQWVSIGNTLALGAGLALGGQLGDQYGRRKMFLIGVAGYIVTTVLCAVAPTGMALAIFRFIQGLVGSLMIPQIFGIIKASVPEAKQPAVFGMYGIVLSLAAIAGPLLGGVLVSWNVFHLSWRLVFFFNVPIAVVAFVLGYLYIPESLASVRQGINVLGAIVVAVATTLVLLPLSLMSTSGWPAWGFPALVLAAALYAFLYVSGMRKLRDQNVRLRQFSLGMAASLLFFLRGWCPVSHPVAVCCPDITAVGVGHCPGHAAVCGGFGVDLRGVDCRRGAAWSCSLCSRGGAVSRVHCGVCGVAAYQSAAGVLAVRGGASDWWHGCWPLCADSH